VCNAAQTRRVVPVTLESVSNRSYLLMNSARSWDFAGAAPVLTSDEVSAQDVSSRRVPDAGTPESLGTVPDGSRLVSCPLCHTTHPFRTDDAFESGGDWRCTRCGQRWDAGRLATVAGYAAWLVAQDTVLDGDHISEARPE
jgi:hypothetical protein